MKKIFRLFLLIVLTLAMVKTEANASTYKGRLYEEYHPSSGFTVFAAESNGWMDYNSWMIKSTVDDRIYYCIDPSIALEGASEGSHDYIIGKEDIIKQSVLTLEKFKKVQLLAYYGYGYKDNNVDHTNKKWYGITQVMIWRIMRPDLTWTFKENRNSTPNENLYKSEVNEMNNLVNNHNKYPSFKDKTITLIVGQQLTLSDTNKVIDSFDVNSKTNDVIVNKSSNSLVLKSSKVHTETINMIKSSRTTEEFALLTSLDYQDIISMGTPELTSFSFKIEVTGGTINLEKVDSVTDKNIPRGEGSFKGAVYEVFDSNNKSVGTITTNDRGKGSISLDYGTYTIKEIKAPEGYKLSDEIYTVSLTKEKDEVTIKVLEKVITGKVKLTKKKGGTDESYTVENNAEFEILDKNDKVVEKLKTNDKGMSIVELPYGTYTIKQTKGIDGYAFIDDIKLEIKEDKIYELDLTNTKLSKLEFTKSDYSTSKPVPNTLIEIYKDEDTLVYSGRTNKDGKIILPNLEIGKYYILEKDAPKEYILNPNKMPFEVKANGEVIKANMKNERKEGFLKFIKKDSSSGKLLSNAKIRIRFIDAGTDQYETTDENGEINKTLKVGSYCVYEEKAPEGYSLKKEPMCFTIEENKTVTLIMKNIKEILVPDTSAYNLKPIISIALITTSLGIFIYEKKHSD